MIKALKYIAAIVALITAIIVIARIRSCTSEPEGAQSVVVPIDSNFVPIGYGSYRPPSIPFVKGKLTAKLPQGMDESDVRRIVSIELQPTVESSRRTISVIETTRDEIYVARDSAIKSVSVVNVQPQIVSFDLKFGVGLSVGIWNDRPGFSPAAAFAPVEWLGWLRAPVITADIDGVGIGAMARIYHDIYLGGARCWRYDTGNQSKITLAFIF